MYSAAVGTLTATETVAKKDHRHPDTVIFLYFSLLAAYLGFVTASGFMHSINVALGYSIIVHLVICTFTSTFVSV
jgi:hypothetical protein